MGMKYEINVPTSGKLELRDITREVSEIVGSSGIEEGLCIVYCPHTTAGLTINENADPDVGSDLERAMERLVPPVRFDHAEGNSPAHFLSSVTGPTLQILIENSQLQLGRWQGLYFCEFDGPRRRRVWVKVIRG
jgi:secondary thiamine-phosphate synthase enzyme